MFDQGRPTFGLRFTLLLCWLASCLGAAAQPAANDRCYHHRIWQFEEGLPQNAVQAVLQSRNGYIWAGTAKGLTRFDGVNFTLYDRKNAPEMGDPSTYCLYESRDGSLWIGTQSGGLNRLKDSRLDHFSAADGLACNSIRALFETRDRTIWIATVQGITTYKNGRFHPFTASGWDPSWVVRAFCEDPTGQLWLGTSKGFYVLSNNVVVPAYSILSQSRAVVRDRRGSLWIGSDNGLFRILPNQQRVRYRTQEGLAANIVSSLFEDRRGNLWIGTYGGLNRFADEKLYLENTSQGASYDQVNSICEDKEGNIWVGSKEGLNRLNAKRFLSYTIQQGLIQNNTMAVLEDKAGAIWTTIWGGGLNRLQNEQVTPFFSSNSPGMLRSDLVLALCEDHRGDLWVGADWNSGLYRLRTNHFSLYPSSSVRVIHEDRQHNLWSGTSTGLQLFQNETNRLFTTAQGLIADSVRALEDDSEGNLWIGTSGGLSRKKADQFSNFGLREGLVHTNVLALYEDPEQNLWIGTAGGLNRYKNGQFRTYTTQEGLFADELLGILDDARGHLWFSSRKGIFRVKTKDFDALDQGTLAKLPCVAYGKQDGMESVQCNGVAKPASWRAQDGRLWFTTTKGLVVIDPKTDTKPNTTAPPIILEEVLIDNQLASLTNLWEIGAKRTLLRLPPGRSRVEFHYTALSYSNPEQNKFKYRLTGFEEHWIDAGTRRAAYYANLRPGRYCFQVIGCNSDGTWNSKGDFLEFILEPYFYQTTWFYGGCGMTLCLLVLGGHRVRVHQLQKRQLELVAQVGERTSNLQAINQQLRQEVSERRQAEEALHLSRETVVRQEKLAVVGQLAAGVAHEFNNILTVIQGHAALMLETHPEADDIDSLESISAGASRAADLTQQMLAFSRQQIMRPQLLDLNELIGRLAKTLAPLLTERISLTWRPAAALPRISADPGMMEQILINLVVNARDAMPQGGKVMLATGTAVISGADLGDPVSNPHAEGAYPGEFIWFRLADSGNGMDPATLKRVFEPFFTTKAIGKGTGLGLATVYGVVRQHNGWIDVTSELGQGTTFTIFLPMTPASKTVQNG